MVARVFILLRNNHLVMPAERQPMPEHLRSYVRGVRVNGRKYPGTRAAAPYSVL